MLKVAALSGGVSAIIVYLIVGLSPTGSTPSDVFWVIAFGLTLGAMASKTSPATWLFAAAIGGFAASGVASAASSVGLVAAYGILTIPAWPAEQSKLQSVALGTIRAVIVPTLVVQVALQLHDFNRSGLSALLAAFIAFVLVIPIIRHATTIARKRAAAGFVGLSIAGTVLGLMAGSAMVSAQELGISLENSLTDARSEFVGGDISSGTILLVDAQRSMTSINSSLSSEAFDVLQYLPGAGPNVLSARQISNDLRAVLDEAVVVSQSLTSTDGLVENGGFNLTGVKDVSVNMDDLVTEIRATHRSLAASRSPWIVPPLEQKLALATEKSAPFIETLESIPSIDDATQWLLGSGEQRRYLILFGNAAEARELGGFTGGTALVAIENGEITVERTDRPSVLNVNPADPYVFTDAPPQRFLEHHPWLFAQNYSAMADFPTLARSVSDLYPAMGGTSIDGLLYLDTDVFSALLAITGPIPLTTGENATAENVGRLLTIDQYETFDERSDRSLREPRESFLAELMESTMDRLISPPIDQPRGDVRPLIDKIEQDRLLFVPFDSSAEALTDAAGLSGAITPLAGNDYIAVSHLNGGPNKLDAYMHRSISYDVDVDAATGEIRSTATITLRNEAPAGLPKYASSNSYGYPAQTNRMTLVVHTPHELIGWSGGDEPELTRSYREFDRWRHERVVAVPRGQSRTVTIELSGTVDPFAQYVLDVDHQPLLHDDDLSVSVTERLAGPVLQIDKVLRVDSTFTASGIRTPHARQAIDPLGR